MQYRRMGRSGLKLSAVSLGAWATFGERVGRSEARELIAQAYAAGVNFFDNAESYAHGEAERLMGDVIADLRLPRDAYCVSSSDVGQRGCAPPHPDGLVAQTCQ
jgi:aryl-alcohol dehydrogenase-like predicted oxidoreductase